MIRHGMRNVFGNSCLALAGVLTLAAAPWAWAQQAMPVAVTPSTGELSTQPLDELDEVVVQGGRLYDRIVKAEDAYFKLFNELNKEDDFDTNCAFVPIDQDLRVEQRFCMPAFFADAKAEQVRLSQYCLSLTARDEDNNVTAQGACFEPPSAEDIFFSRREAYVDNVIKVTNSDTRLAKLAAELDAMHRQRDALAHRYEDIKAQEVATTGEKNRFKPTIR